LIDARCGKRSFGHLLGFSRRRVFDNAHAAAFFDPRKAARAVCVRARQNHAENFFTVSVRRRLEQHINGRARIFNRRFSREREISPSSSSGNRAARDKRGRA
jgi:hypothetical protein